MYYPLLRARQFELIALRELVKEQSIQGYVTPILEPVKESITNMMMAARIFGEENQLAYLIVNPLVGDFTGDGSHYVNLLRGFENTNIRAAFYYRENSAYILQTIAENYFQNCMVICSTDTTLNDQPFVN